jgi:hypothetical protein
MLEHKFFEIYILCVLKYGTSHVGIRLFDTFRLASSKTALLYKTVIKLEVTLN